jgi:hypothetical protein
VIIVAMSLQASLEQILASPTADELWSLQKELLDVGGVDAARAREVAKAFHACLRTLHSKAASRSASRWGAALGTAAVASVSLPEILQSQERGLGELLELTLRAALEVGASVKSAEAWEVEAGHVYAALPHLDRATLVDMFRSVLAARVLPLLG